MPSEIPLPEQLAIARQHVAALEAQAVKQSLRTLEDTRHIQVLEGEVDSLLELTKAAEDLQHRLEDQTLANVILTSENDHLRDDQARVFKQSDELVAEVAFLAGEKARLQDAYMALKHFANNTQRMTAIMRQLKAAQDDYARVSYLLREVNALIRPHTNFFGRTVLRAEVPPLLQAQIDEALS